jgi:hypothetical protein
MLGEGSQGRVCLCKFEGKSTQSISDLFVVKILQQNILRDEDPEVHLTRLEHMSNELQILVILSHSNFLGPSKPKCDPRQLLDQKEICILRGISHTNRHGLLPRRRALYAAEGKETTSIGRSLVLRSHNSSGPG